MKKSPKSAKFFASHWSAFLQQFKNLHLRGDRFVMLTVAGLINAFGVSVFLYPVNLYDSGISGTAMLLAQITPDWCSLSLIAQRAAVPLRAEAAGRAVHHLRRVFRVHLLPRRVADSGAFAA